MPTLLVRHAGILTTIQDLGRPGWGAFGVPVSGAMDTLALRAANALVGNRPGSAALELTGPGASLTFALDEPRLLAVAGADLEATITDGAGAWRALPSWQAAVVANGETLRFPRRRTGARALLAVAGAIDVGRRFGATATDVANRIGGADGRPLRAGDRLTLGGPSKRPTRTSAPLPAALATAYLDPWRLRFIPTPTATAAQLDWFTGASFLVTPQGNRIGFRLRSADGAPLPDAGPIAGGLSEPIAPGTLQVPPDGQPILLMADRQTVGGYPVLGHVISADLPKAAQLWPGDSIRFGAITVAEAREHLWAQHAAFAVWQQALA